MTTDYKPENSISANFDSAVEWRRTLHRCPQPSWLEFFATAFVAEKLSGWGYALTMGKDIIPADKQLLLPGKEKLDEEYQRALKAGAKEEFLAKARGGFTGVVAVLKGDKPGPTVAFSFYIDYKEVME
jgi:aminobenzoyl-glutamate utilization protein A